MEIVVWWGMFLTAFLTGFLLLPIMGTCYFFIMRVLGTHLFVAYAKRKPRTKGFLVAFRAFVEASNWKRMKDVEAQFARVATFTPPDCVAFDFPDEGVRIEMRLNGALGLARVYSVGPSASKREKQ